jgi:hypothetical protein
MTPAEIKYSVIELYVNIPHCGPVISIHPRHWNQLINAHQPRYFNYVGEYAIELGLEIKVIPGSRYKLERYDAEITVLPHNGISNVKFYHVKFNKAWDRVEVVKTSIIRPK